MNCLKYNEPVVAVNLSDKDTETFLSQKGLDELPEDKKGRAVIKTIEELFPDEGERNAFVEEYTKELDHISAIFHAHKGAPPIYKNYPAVAGAIAWARDLYNRAKKPILRFKVWMCPKRVFVDMYVVVACTVVRSEYSSDVPRLAPTQAMLLQCDISVTIVF